jgi:hypothetical protein
VKDDVEAVADMASSAGGAHFRKLKVEGEEHSDLLWQRVTYHVNQEDVPWAAIR